MTCYELEMAVAAKRQLKKLPADARRRVSIAALALRYDPRPQGSRKLFGYDDVFRIRVGPYRILYSVADHRLVVLIIKIGNRRDVYRR